MIDLCLIILSLAMLQSKLEEVSSLNVALTESMEEMKYLRRLLVEDINKRKAEGESEADALLRLMAEEKE